MSVIIFILCLPFFIIYFILCFTIPLIKIGKITKGNDLAIYITKDTIHADYVFELNQKYTKIGWGDRKIFLETKSWNDLKLKDFLKAFWGLNPTVLRIEQLDQLPKNSISIKINQNQLEIIKKHIQDSHNGNLIEKKENYYQLGDYYESNLKYNCINTCNNWVNQGLKKAKISNRIWCPITYWI